MTGTPKLEIQESVEELKELMKRQKTSLAYAKVQSLYLLKTGIAETIRYVAVIIGREESTIHRWLQRYREGGIKALLEKKLKTGRPKKLEVENVAKLQQELRDPEGFSSYQEVEIWSIAILGIQVSYATLYQVIRRELKAKLKVPRPQSDKQEETAIGTWKKSLLERVKALKERSLNLNKLGTEMAYWCQDETRLGLRTIGGKKLTLSGIKPKGIRQWQFEYYYVYGLVEPKSGRSFFYEFSHLNAACFQIFLEEFAKQYPSTIHIIQLDNAPCHTAKKLKIPDNIILLFQPPYCPEVNPIERFWQFLKSHLTWALFDSLPKLQKKVATLLNSIREEIVHSLVGWDYILRALSLAGL